MCPECGRPGDRLKKIKGRWKRSWDAGNRWTREDFEVWVDPDEERQGPSVLLKVWNSIRHFPFPHIPHPLGTPPKQEAHKKKMANSTFFQDAQKELEKEEEIPEKKAITRRKKRAKKSVKKKVVRKRKKSTNGRRKKTKQK